ncbi:amino acid adenylation domain-containing protein [Leptothoe sp. LEGE 181152]|nr:amino acid adenylation domain-containing protein [Leptothoe sp. LEGE 181152]
MSLREKNVAKKSQLSLAKQQLLERRLRGERGSSEQRFPAIVPGLEQRYHPFPLTDIQQAYWIGRQGGLELGNISTHGYFEIETDGISPVQLNQAWQQLIQRHEMLRMIIRQDGQQQILSEVPDYQIQVTDLRGASAEALALKSESIRQQMSHQVFPLEQWPLFEIQAIYLNPDQVRFCFSLDVLIGDAWSCELLLAELADLVRAPGRSLPPLKLSFRDYVLAELEFHKFPLYKRSKDYWEKRLITLPPAPELPLQKSLASVDSPHFVRREKQMDATTWRRLKQRAHRANLTPSGILLAAFAEILTLWSKNPKFTLNLTLYNRLPLHPDVDKIVGDFTSVTLLSVDNTSSTSFETRAKRLQEQFWDDLDHSYYSGVKVIRELARIQNRPAEALTPVIFTSTLTNESLSREQSVVSPSDGLPDNLNTDVDTTYNRDMLKGMGKMTYMITQTPQVYLDHQVFFNPSGELFLNWDCVEELFPEGVLDDMFAAYGNLLERLATEEAVWQATSPGLLPKPQVAQIAAINQTESSLGEDRGRCLHGLFFERVANQPDQPAVIASDRTLTYQELSDLAQQLGQQLRRLGAQPNHLVAVVMAKGWEQIVAVLGILTSGAAYVPIDPNLPQERRWHLLEQGNIDLVLTQTEWEQTLKWPTTTTRICVDTLKYERPEGPLEFVQRPEDIAYVIYTSGSTGLPKGVTIDHQGVVNTVLDINQRFGVSQRDRTFALSSLSFDLSVYDIFGTLAAGGTLVLPKAEANRDPAHWLELIIQHQVTLWNSVPALMQMLIEYAAAASKPIQSALRLVLLSGDWLPLKLPEQIRTTFTEAQVISLGGATEASIWSILYPIAQVSPGWKSIPYGYPMANQRMYVLDHALNTCPLFVPGQLYIGGVGLAKGYWHNPTKTDASFIHHPQTGERLYCTGDIGRYLPDGVIEFLGREDFQVKINGHRIELGEIEATLVQHPAIDAAVVTAIEERPGVKRLVAYPVTAQSAKTESQLTPELRKLLAEKLPAYMVPSTFIFLDSLPLTANGKVDRRQLPQPDLSESPLKQAYVAPTDEIEKQLSDIIQTILKIPQVGIYDNFFDLGGNSVHLVQTHIKIREILNQDIPLIEMFRYPTVQALSQYFCRSSNNNNVGHRQLTRAKHRKQLQQRRQTKRRR